MSAEASRRASRLRAVFKGTISGERPILAAAHAKQFLEAVQTQDPPTACVETLVASKSGRDAVGRAIRVDLSTAFLLAHTLPFFRYLSDPGVKALAGGQLLQDLLLAIAQPPTVWNLLVNLFRSQQLPSDAFKSLAWLALELVSLPTATGVDVLSDVRSLVDGLLQSECHETRQLAYQMDKVSRIRASAPQDGIPENGPGGRHDNDHSNFRQIRIYPTTDEFLSTQTPFYRTVRDVFATALPDRARVHLDNQFRLLREDMLAEMREDILVATGKKKGSGKPRQRSLELGHLVPVGIEMAGIKNRPRKCCLAVQCYSGSLQFLRNKSVEERKKFLDNDKSFLHHQSFGVLCRHDELFGFAFVHRDIDGLAKSPPVVQLQFSDTHGLRSALLALKHPSHAQVRFLLVDTPVFAYEPVLHALQEIKELPLQGAITNPGQNLDEMDIAGQWPDVWDQLQQAEKDDGCCTLSSSLRLDEAQYGSLLCAFANPVCLIQGPPGTGKSFIGAQIARYIHQYSARRILVLSYTNHALDQFLEDLLKVDIPPSDMVRIGNKDKCSPATAPLALSGMPRSYRRSRDAWSIVNCLEAEARDIALDMERQVDEFQDFALSWAQLSEYLEFEDARFFDALQVPEADGWTRKDKQNKNVGPGYLFNQWKRGLGAGVFKEAVTEEASDIWKMPRSARQAHIDRWTKTLLEERLGTIQELARQHTELVDKLAVQWQERDVEVLKERRIIGCTTTAAAKYAHLLRSARPDVVLVEEAGEILESHILTALSPTVRQMVLIGDHQQLRPKVNNYALTVDKGDGFDLDCSLFERMISQGAPYTTLCQQHRMVPEISVLARRLTYPELLDGPGTSGRPRVLGLRDRVVFVNHDKLEDLDGDLRDRRDAAGGKASKKNSFEAEMVVRCIKYLGQQGYGADQMVVLTPYLGQLRALRDTFTANQHDPDISELDRAELLRAGLMTHAASKVDRRPIRISTIDNYQGEESDIVIASLTRANERGDIGFMAAPERLNVLLTRARNGLVLLGNMATFKQSKKGADTWQPFFELMREGGHLYDGLPVQCERHPERVALLSEPVDFSTSCPDGGCDLPCNAPLQCGLHQCKSRCHRITDHSKTECHAVVDKTCTRQHRSRVSCGRRNDGCRQCAREDAETERRIRLDIQLEADRMQRQVAYTLELERIKDEIDLERRRLQYAAEEEEQKKTLAQQRADLDSVKEAARLGEKRRDKEREKKKAPTNQQKSSSYGEPPDLDTARGRWEHLKRYDGAKSSALDKLMDMVGLEEVKQEFLSIKTKVDTTLRQGASLTSERFNCSLLGNPGTGKTTVARLFADFLASVGVVPSPAFHETTGAALSNMGVSGCKKLVDNMLTNGGGVVFVDEAYQLTSGNSPGGKAVLDYLLPEVENLTGKIVFVLAGYARQMESFFSHNPGLPSRFPLEIKFADYEDAELLRIMEHKIDKRYGGSMRCQDGSRGLYCRIATRRIGRGRGKDGFGNARAIENLVSVIARRQADRLQKERLAGTKPDDFFLSKEDLIGPEPADALVKCTAWKKLQNLQGLDSVKEAIGALVDSIQETYRRELEEEPPVEYSLNKVFLGNPGTGKTTVAKLYGEILVALGLLSKGEVLLRNPSDFVGSYMGQSEQQTKGILAAAVGKVLVIDEAYGLYGGGENGAFSDPYRTAVIDTIVADVQSVPGDDRCVLLLGYKEQMEAMFQNVNPGLSRRFPMASAFVFEDFSDDDLAIIFDRKLQQTGYRAADQAKQAALEVLGRARNRPNFGNAGEIDILLDAAKSRHQRRISREKTRNNLFQAVDFDPEFDRAQRSETNVRMLFHGTVGCDDTIRILEGYQHDVRTLKAIGMDPKESIPFNFLFRGPPGTGKTTTAKKMGKVFYDMGFLASAEVVECSAADLVGQFVGQTAPRVQKLLDRALGKVLFVDEAYRLAEGHFAKEAMDELVDSATKDRYAKKLVIILAGYEADINRLMSVNPGLTSRFPEVVEFRGLMPDECYQLLVSQLQGKKAQVEKQEGASLDLSVLEVSGAFRQAVIDLFARLAQQANWASARDVKELAKNIFTKTLRGSSQDPSERRFVVRQDVVESELQAMLKERESRGREDGATGLEKILKQHLQAPPPTQGPPKTETRQATVEKEEEVEEEEEEEEEKGEEKQEETPNGASRDAGVSDEVWEQLQRDQKAQEEKDAELGRQQEAARKAAGRAREELVARLMEEEERRQLEVKRRQKLQELGVCPMGFQWIKQSGGYRCAGGSHFVPNDAVDKLAGG